MKSPFLARVPGRLTTRRGATAVPDALTNFVDPTATDPPDMDEVGAGQQPLDPRPLRAQAGLYRHLADRADVDGG